MCVCYSFVWRDGQCNAKLALGATVSLQESEHVDAYIGLPCSIGNHSAYYHMELNTFLPDARLVYDVERWEVG